MSYYDILEITPNASPEVIRMAYKALAKKYHPDVYKGNKVVAERKMKQLNEAYAVLSNPEERKRYDNNLHKQENYSKQERYHQDDVSFADVNDDFTEQPANNTYNTNYNQNNGQGRGRQETSDNDKLPLFFTLPVILVLLFVDFTRWIGVILLIGRIGHNSTHPQHKLTKAARNLIISAVIILCISKFGILNFILKDTSSDSSTDYSVSENSNESSSPDVFVTDPEYIKWYADEKGIKLHHWNTMKSFLKKLEKLTTDMDTKDLIMLTLEDGGFKEDYLKQSLYNIKYAYVGELKDNKPHGIGLVVTLDGWLVYCGEFSEGRYSGFGMEFMEPFESDILAVEKQYGSDSFDFYCNRINPILYFGEFENNKRQGKGNTFVFSSITTEFDPELYPLSRDIDITVGEFKKDELCGKYKVYADGYLYREANIEQTFFTRKGKVIQYFPKSTNIQYTGETKNGRAHGKGTLYDEYGEVIYSGKWKNGNYQ